MCIFINETLFYVLINDTKIIRRMMNETLLLSANESFVRIGEETRTQLTNNCTSVLTGIIGS